MIPTCMRTIHYSEGESFRRALTALLTDVFGFLGDEICPEPQQHTALCSPTSQAELQLSQSRRYPLSWNWAATATALTSVLGTKQVQTQTSVSIIAGITSCKAAAHFYFSNG